jgi:hypothetical protein
MILPNAQLPLTLHLAPTIKDRLNKQSAVVKAGQVKAKFFDSYQMHNENFHTVRPMFTTLAKSLTTNHFSPPLPIKILPECNIMYLVVGHIIQGVPLPTKPGISFIILKPIKILQQDLNRSTFVM